MKILYYIPSEYNSNDIPYKLISGIENKNINYLISTNYLNYIITKIKNRDVDLIHIFGFDQRIFKIESILYRFSNIKIIVHLLNRDDVEAYNKLKPNLKRRIKALIFADIDLEPFILKDKVIPVYCILPGTNIEYYYPQVLKQLSIKKEVISYCDMSSNTKLHVLVESMRYLPPQYFLTIIGNNLDNDYFEQLQDLATNLSVKSRIEFITNFYEQDIKDKLSESNVFITISDNSTSMTNAYKALLFGTPVICPDKEYGINGLYSLDSFAPKIIARQIKEICESDELVDVNEAKKYLSWSAKVKELEEIYENLMRR